MKTSEPIENMKKINPEENILEIQKIFNKLKKYGFTFIQWSDVSMPENSPGYYKRLIERYPEYPSMDNWEEKEKLIQQFNQTQPDYFFMEAFGPTFLRQDENTFLECAQGILQKHELQLSCEHKKWRYTHRNGYKTCELCDFFAPCTITEAKQHYTQGTIRYDATRILQFDRENPLCDCGSHEIYQLEKSFLPEKKYQCAACFRYIPEKNDRIGTTFERKIRHIMAFQKGKLLRDQQIQTTLLRYFNKMYQHALYIEKIEENESFLMWSLPYTKRFIQAWNIYYEKENQTYRIEGVEISNLQFKEGQIVHFQVQLMLKKIANQEVETKEKTINQVIETIMKCF